MTYTDKILAEFDEKFFTKETFDWKNPTPGEIKEFIVESILQAIAEEKERVRCNLPEIRVSRLSLLLDDCPNCGQVVNRSFVDDLTCRIQDEYKQKILASLDKTDK